MGKPCTLGDGSGIYRQVDAVLNYCKLPLLARGYCDKFGPLRYDVGDDSIHVAQ
jgi:hypothetical protein